MGGGGGGDGGAGKREKERQAKISEGYEQIRRIFDGASSGVNEVPAFEVGGQYFTADGKPVTVSNRSVPATNFNANGFNANGFNANGFNANGFNANGFNANGFNANGFNANGFNANGFNANGFNANRQVNKPINLPGYEMDGSFFSLGETPNDWRGKPIFAQGGKLFSGVQTTPGFDEDFYNQREQAYTDFAMPQLDDQYGKAQQQLLYALARTGRLQSSTRGNRFADLQRDFDIQKTNVADKARQAGGDARAQVERARADLVALNNSVADPTAIAQQAQLSSNVMRSMPAFDPMAPLFQNVTEGIATQAELERRNQARYNTGVFASPTSGSGSGRIVR